MGLELPFAALAGGALGFISPCRLFPAVSLSLFFFTFLLCETLHTPLCDPLMNFSLFAIYQAATSTSLLSLYLRVALSLTCLSYRLLLHFARG